jgi:protein gp37
VSTSKTEIAWTDRTWNPIRGCSRVSEGCRNCYAERMAARFSKPGKPFHGFAEAGRAGSLWTGRVELVPRSLDEPLRWRKPQRIFVDSMSDLFHDGLSNEAIAAVFGVMAAAPQHTFQVLTKRAARMTEWFAWAKNTFGRPERGGMGYAMACFATDAKGSRAVCSRGWADDRRWPLPNVMLGVSVEDQRTADERIPLLLETPAAKRFVSYEPALGPVDFEDFLRPLCECELQDPLSSAMEHDEACPAGAGPLHQIIVGGESGPGARPFDVAWARSVVAQCREAGVACFVKQLGANLFDRVVMDARGRVAGGVKGPRLKDRKGGDMAEWPEELRVREFPA